VPTKVREVADTDALAYIAAVQAADGQDLEDSVKFAYEDFILGCKSDGIWGSLKAACILAGARTLPGILVPLVGTAPTNNNFVSADYNRKTGLKGNTTTKYINAQRAINADPQNSHHYGVYVTEAPTLTTTRGFIGNAPGTGVNNYMQGFSNNPNFQAYNRHPVASVSNQGLTLGYKGTSRSASNAWSVRSGGATTNFSTASVTPNSSAFGVFARGTTTFADARMSFYSIGEHLNLTLLDTRVSNLMTALAAAIP
jgi:hypothetical protein